jgi:hypothetical protein
MSKTLITFYRCVLIFNVMKPLQNLSMAHGLSWKAVLSQVWSKFSWLLHKIWYTHSSVLLDIRSMMQAQTWLFTCDDCVRLNGCSEVLLTQGKQDHNACTFWSSPICGCKNTALNILNYTEVWSTLCPDFPCTDWIESLEAPDLVWSLEEKKNLLLLPGITLWVLLCTAHSVFIVPKNYSSVSIRCGARMCPTT